MARKACVLTIHLESASERLPQVRKNEASITLDSRRIAAVSSDDAKRELYEPNLHNPPYPFPLQSAELACFESHRRAWQCIVDSEFDFGLVVEDDADIIDPAFSTALELALEHALPEDLVRFPIKHRERIAKTIASTRDTQLYLPDHIGLGCVCQLVGRDAAKRLLATSEKVDRPVDAFIQLFWLTGVYPLCVAPSGVKEVSDELGGSLIHRRNIVSVERVLTRTVKRFLYRTRLRLVSQLHSPKVASGRTR